jgi:YD repeat-containing protein
MATRKKSSVAQIETYPKIVKGNHLTVITHENGKTELEWDDAALLKEVQDAILSVEQATKPAVKSTRKKKAENV